MRLRRTHPFVLLGSSIVLLCSSCHRAPKQVTSTQKLLLSGPMLADVTPTSVRLWAEASQAVTYQVQVRRTDIPSEWCQAGGPNVRSALRLNTAGHRGAVRLDGLRPNTPYAYRLLTADGNALPDLHGQTFRTAPVEGTPQDFRVAFGSCAGEWGENPSQPIFQAIDAQAPDLFLWLGDNTYFTVPGREWESPNLMEQRWSRSRAMASLQPMLAHTAQYAIWDDHDFGPNDSDRTYPLRDVAKDLFQSYWPNPAAGLSAEDGIFFRFTFGRVEFFMLDTRYARSPNDSPNGPDKVILSAAQWRWLEQGLRSSTADFKVIASGMQILSDYHPFETWNLFPHERARLLDFIRDEKVSGVFFISGDRHIGEALRVPQQGSYALVEFTSSPLAAGLGETQPDAKVPQRIPGTLAAVENFAVLDFHFAPPGAVGEDRGAALSFRLYNVYGEPLGNQVVLRLSQLQP
jgi:alkaline phosphatase D